MAKTRGIAQTNAPSSRKRKKSPTEAMLINRSLSTTPPTIASRGACPYTVAALATSPLNFGIPHTLPILPSFPLQPYPSIHTPSLTSPFGTPNPTKPPFGAATCVAATNHNTNP